MGGTDTGAAAESSGERSIAAGRSIGMAFTGNMAFTGDHAVPTFVGPAGPTRSGVLTPVASAPFTGSVFTRAVEDASFAPPAPPDPRQEPDPMT